MSGLNTAISRLDAAWQTLQQRWNDTKAVWNDPVRRSFEQEYWAPLERQMPAVQRELERLAQVVAAARRSVK